MSSIASSSRSALRSVSRSTGLCVRQAARPAVVSLPSSGTAMSLFPRSRSFFSLNDISKLANTLTGNTENEDGTQSRGVESDGEFQKFHARKILPYSQAQLYSLVSDVPSYSSFIPFCNSSRVLAGAPGTSGEGERTRRTVEWKPDDQPFDLEAELMVGFGGLEEKYTSRVVGKPFESVTATAAKQSPLFKSLKTTWSFSPASPLSPHSSAALTPASDSTSRPPNSTEEASPEVGPTLLTIDLVFSFANPLHRIASQAVLPKVADKMVEAFEHRCLEVYGRGSA